MYRGESQLCSSCRAKRERAWRASPKGQPRPETRLEQAHRELDDLAEYLAALAEVAGCAQALNAAELVLDCPGRNDLRRALRRLDAAK